MGEFDSKKIKISKQWKIALVVAQFNKEITSMLAQSAKKGLLDLGIIEDNIFEYEVPGSFELPLVSLKAALSEKIDAVIAIGVIIRGGTPHFEYVSIAATNGILEAGLKSQKPVIFGVLTVNNKQEALDRCGGKEGNKGGEFAESAIRTLEELVKITSS